MVSLRGKIVTPSQVLSGVLVIEDGRIAAISPNPPKSGKIYDFGDALIVPGFVNIHVHGFGEFTTDDKANILGMAKLQPRFGTTSFLPTSAAMTVDEYINMGKDARIAVEELKGQGTKIQGVHMEGPYINPDSDGAMAVPTRRPFSISETQVYIDGIGDFLKLMTLSPEMEGGLEVIKLLVSNGVVVSIGHPMTEPKQLADFVQAGLTHACHLFDSYVQGKEIEPGVYPVGLIETILANDKITCEIICDMHHVAPELMKITSKVLAPDRFVAITDSVKGAGLPGQMFEFPNGTKYKVGSDVARTVHDNCFAGSILTMDKAFANLINNDLADPILAAKFTATNPARVIGIDDQTGSLEMGKCADIAVIDNNYNCIATFVDGNMVYGKGENPQ